MKLKIILIVTFIAVAGAGAGWWFFGERPKAVEAANEFTGSTVCRECHAKFFELWSTSWHGLAMQPFNAAFVEKYLTPQEHPIDVRGKVCWVEIGAGGAVMHERGPEGEKTYSIEHAMGGKNVFFFLTPFAGGRLQVLPLAYDARNKEWYDTTGSMVRHLRDASDEPLDWTERPLTFNASCYNCHVSQLEKNYSLETDSYNTVWGEPGINCEACHGPGKRHVEEARAAGDDLSRDRLQLIVTKDFDVEQTNSMCSPCHAKMTPLTTSFRPGDRYFDHYNLITLEDRDFYPDGRDLGENFTYTLWKISPCAASGQLDCMHCHTSSGRNKFTGADADKACLPCHAGHVNNPAAHSFHAAASTGSRCVACHMPRTTFARMYRHDHSLLPPAPAATLKFDSPNACNICHTDRDARWADTWVRKWYPRDYQAPLLHRGSLIEAARKEDWSRLDEMVAYVTDPARNELFAASLLRLLDRCRDAAKWPAFMAALEDPSPLVRSSAAVGLAANPDPRVLEALARAAGDPYRVVRIQAAIAMARLPLDSLGPDARRRVDAAFAEYEASMRCQPDDPRSHYNLANYYQENGNLGLAKKEYGIALRQMPSFVPALVNLSVLHARLGESDQTDWALREAVRYAPNSAEANFNLGLHLAERGQMAEAETRLRAAWKADPMLAEAAYNLAVLVADREPDETISLCRKAAALRPLEPKFAYTLAFYLRRNGDDVGAADVLRNIIRQHPEHTDALTLLGSIYEETGRRDQALRLYKDAVGNEALPGQARAHFATRATALEQR